MMNTEILIERSPEIVWKYFTTSENWEKWRGGIKSAEWIEGGKIYWKLGGSTTIASLVPNELLRFDGSLFSTTFTVEPNGKGKSKFKIHESSPKGGAMFNDGGAAHLAGLNNSLKKLKEHIETETENDSEKKSSSTEYICPYCNSKLQGMALITTQVSMDSGVVDFQTNCSSCGKVLYKNDFMKYTKQKETPTKTKDVTEKTRNPIKSAKQKVTTPPIKNKELHKRKWWELWK